MGFDAKTGVWRESKGTFVTSLRDCAPDPHCHAQLEIALCTQLPLSNTHSGGPVLLISMRNLCITNMSKPYSASGGLFISCSIREWT